MSRPLGLVPPAAIRTEGQRLLLEVPDILREVAEVVGCKSLQSVANWRSGEKLPTHEARAKLYSGYGIPIEAWTQRPRLPGGALQLLPTSPLADELTADAEEALAHSSSSAHPSSLDDCLALLGGIRTARNEKGITSSELIKLAAAETRILALRLRLEQAAEFAESRYVTDHPAWLRLRRAIVKALEAHPLAAQAVSEAIASVEASKI